MVYCIDGKWIPCAIDMSVMSIKQAAFSVHVGAYFWSQNLHSLVRFSAQNTAKLSRNWNHFTSTAIVPCSSVTVAFVSFSLTLVLFSLLQLNFIFSLLPFSILSRLPSRFAPIFHVPNIRVFSPLSRSPYFEHFIRFHHNLFPDWKNIGHIPIYHRSQIDWFFYFWRF